jgi:predicted phage tail protein
MKPRTPALVLATAVLLAASAASAAVPSMQSLSTQTRAPAMSQSDNGNQRVTFFNKQGHVQNAPTHYAQIWGDAALGG